MTNEQIEIMQELARRLTQALDEDTDGAEGNTVFLSTEEAETVLFLIQEAL